MGCKGIPWIYRPPFRGMDMSFILSKPLTGELVMELILLGEPKTSLSCVGTGILAAAFSFFCYSLMACNYLSFSASALFCCSAFMAPAGTTGFGVGTAFDAIYAFAWSRGLVSSIDGSALSSIATLLRAAETLG